MRKTKIYGIKSVEINGAVVNICNVQIADTAHNRMLVRELGGSDFRHLYGTKPYRKNGVIAGATDVIRFEMTTMDFAKFHDYRVKVGNILREAALNKHNDKYAWTQPADLFSMQA